MTTASASAMNTTAATVAITAPATATGWRASAARLDTVLLLQARHVGNERVELCRGQLAVFRRHGRLLGGARLLGHRDRVDDPGADVGGREFRADAVERTGLTALAGNRVADRTLLRRVHLLPLLDR